jgi:hypothetical protein
LSHIGLWALYICTAPPSTEAWSPALAKVGGTARFAPLGSIERNEPGAWSAFAFGAPKLERLPTTMRVGSSTRPGWVKAARVGLEPIGLPGRKVPMGETADDPGIPSATTRPLMEAACPPLLAREVPAPPTVARPAAASARASLALRGDIFSPLRLSLAAHADP